MQRKQSFSYFITICVILTQLLAGVSGALPVQVAAAAPAPVQRVETVKPPQAAAPAPARSQAAQARQAAVAASSQALAQQRTVRNVEHAATGATNPELARPLQPESAAAAPPAAPLAQSTLTIGDLVWQDTNVNGLQDAGEPGIPDVTVGLYDASGNAVLCPQPSPVNLALNKTATQVSNFSSSYLASSAVDGNTTSGMAITNSSANSWWQVDLGQAAALRQVVIYDRPDNVAHAQTEQIYVLVSAQPFASTNLATTLADPNVWKSTLQGTWTGTSLNVDVPNYVGRYVRIQHSNTDFLALGEVQVYGYVDLPVTTVTDGNGLYSFTSANCLQANTNYQVRIATNQAALRGLSLATPNAGGVTNNDPAADDSDSDATSVTQNNIVYASLTLTSPGSGANASYDFGFTPVGLGNYVWQDTNTNGLQESGEPGIAGVTLNLYENGNPVMCVRDQTGDYLDTGASATDSAGSFVWASQPWTFSSAGVTSGGNPGNTVYVYGNGTATRAVGLSVFGAYPTVSYDYAYLNTTAGYSHVVEYSADGGVTWQSLATYTTSSGAAYQSASFTLPSLSATARIRIRGTGGTTVNYLRIDNLHIVGGISEPVTTITDSDGRYSFTGADCVQPNDQYQIRMDRLQPLLRGLYLTTPNAGGVTSNTAPADANDSDALASTFNGTPYAVITATAPAVGLNNSYAFGFVEVGIGDYVWRDSNTDGVQDATEPGMAGVTVGLYDNSGNPVLCVQDQTKNYLDTGASATDSAGSLDWSGKAWTFTSAGVTTGGNPGNTVYVYGNGTATRAVDLSVFGTYPTLTYDYAYANATAGYSHVVEYSPDGGTTWQALAGYSTSTGTAYQSASFTLPTLSATARIRIRGLLGTTANSLKVDNLRIEGGVATPATTVTDSTGHYGFDGRCVQPNTAYQVRVDMQQDAVFGLYLTTPNAGGVTSNDPTADNNDSDASLTPINGAPTAVINLTAPAAGINKSYAFGFVPEGLGNMVWKDNNANNRQDAGEPGIAGLTVDLYDSSGNQVLCPQVGRYDTYLDQFTTATNTNSDGTLSWSGKAWTFAGTASILTTNGNPGGSLRVYGSATTNMATRAVDLSVFASAPTLHFDYNIGSGTSFNVQYSSNGGTSFTTLGTLGATNGYQTIAYTLPSTAANAQIRFQGTTGAVYGYFDNLTIEGQQRFPVTTVTDAAGLYSFTGAQCVQPNTNYQVRLATAQDPLVGLTLATQNAGGVTSNDPILDDSDSDASLVTSNGTTTAVINATAPAIGVNTSYDFGFVPLEIGNLVWQDTNADGLQDRDEPGIPGVTVSLYDSSGNQVLCPQVGRYDTYLDQFTTATTTNSDGTLSWSGKAWTFAGTASILTTNGNPGGSLRIYGSAITNMATRAVDLSVFASPPTLRFDYNIGSGTSFNVQYSSNGGTSFTTLGTLGATNGYQTIAYTLPSTAANAQIRLQGTTGAVYGYFDNLTIEGQQRYPVTTVTDANGLYSFTAANCVQPNTNYQVRLATTQKALAGLSLTTQNADGVTSNDPTADNHDSDASLTPISGVPTAVLNATAPAVGVNYSYAFGFTPLELGNYVWRDTNANGLQDAGEPGLAGVTVGLYDASGNAALCSQPSPTNLALNKTATQVSNYSSSNLASSAVDGNTTSGMALTNSSANSWWQVDLGQAFPLRQVVLYARPDGAGHGQTEQVYVLVSAQPFASTNLATTLADANVWHSTLQGGWTGTSLTVDVPDDYVGRYVRIQHSNTDYLALGEVQVYGNVDWPVTTVTDANGRYSFSAVQCLQPNTTYQVRTDATQTALRGLLLTRSNAGGVTSNDPTLDNNDSDAVNVTLNNKLYVQLTATTLAAGVNASYDFGFTPVTIGNTVWKDVNADGVQASGEPGIPGVTVGLYDNSGNPVLCPQVGRYDTYQDSFNAAGVDRGSTGTLFWDTSWHNTNTVIIGTNGNPGGSLQAYAMPTYYTTRVVDLSVFAGQPTLRFDYNFGGVRLNFAIQASPDDGATFQTLATLSDNNSTYKTITYTLPITAANAQIRIQGVSGANYGYFDNLTIRGQQRFPVTTITDANGRYTFSGAECIEPSTPYQLRIATLQKPLAGLSLTTPNAGGVTSNDPTGDVNDSDATGLTSNDAPYAVIPFTAPAAGLNTSYAFGFTPSPVGSIMVNKTVNGAASATGWQFTLSSANCLLPTNLSNPLTTATGVGGAVTFANLLVKDGSGAACQYQVSETSKTGWFLNYAVSDPLTGIQVTANRTTTVAVVNNQNQSCDVTSGNVGGLVFQDFNLDGQQNSPTLESPFTRGGIVVRAYSKNNQLLASVPLQPDGTYRFANLPNLATEGVRIEFQNLAAVGVEPTSYTAAASTSNRTSDGLVRFVKAPTCTVDLGVNRPANYCQANPWMAVPTYYKYDVPNGTGALQAFTYNATTPTLAATDTQIGATWGEAYQAATKTLFVSAFTRAEVGYGPLGRGGIYAVDMNNPAARQVTPFVDLQTLGVNTGGTGPRPAAVDAEVGKSGIGDIDISEDGKTLYIMNLYQRELVMLDIASKTVIQKVPVPDPGCLNSSTTPPTPAPQDRRPWAIEVYQGDVYIGLVCSAETSQRASDLRSYIMRLQGKQFVPFYNFPLTVSQLAWLPWGSSLAPLLSDFQFDENGSLSVVVVNQTDYKHSTDVANGDVFKIANVNGKLAASPTLYYENAGLHSGATVGGSALKLGSGEFVASLVDPGGVALINGVSWYDSTTGKAKRALTIPQGFSKGAGLGDLEVLCDLPPLEIGNRVWNDSAVPNGVQDPNEPGIASVIVGLYNITGTLVATTTTNALGEYYFNNANVPGGLMPNTDYTIRINRTQPPLANLNPTLLNQVLNNPVAPDEHDSDGNPATYAGYVTTPLRTGGAGENDYSYDFGFNNTRYDWGDNPDTGVVGVGSYNTVMTATGPVHVIVPGLRLGATEDAETDGQPNVTATGDGADEDGVRFPTLTAGSTAVLTVTATNTGTTAALLAGWLDFNGDGLFAASERVTTTVPAGTTNGVFYLRYSVPLNAASATYARFRLSTDPAAAQPTGVALDGEVEDYPVSIRTVSFAQFGDRVWIETDNDGLANTGVITPVAGIVITATAGTQTYTTTTNSQGYYSFTVAPGLYTVRYGSVPATYGLVYVSATPGGNAEQGNAGSYQATGNPDKSHANGTTVAVADGEANWQVDFAFYVPHADLRLVKQVDKTTAKPGDTLVYTLVLTNNGPDTATNVKVKDLLPADMRYQSATAQQGSYDATTGVWTVGTLVANNSVTLTITVQVR